MTRKQTELILKQEVQEGFGIELDARKTFRNMLLDFTNKVDLQKNKTETQKEIQKLRQEINKVSEQLKNQQKYTGCWARFEETNGERKYPDLEIPHPPNPMK